MKKRWITRLGIVAIVALLALGGINLGPQRNVPSVTK